MELADEYEVITAEDGLSAMDQALKFKPDVFVIDWMLPKVPGPQIVNILRRTQEFATAPIIFVSAKATRRDRRVIEDLRVSEFLGKPFPIADLLAAVKRAVAEPDFRIHTNRRPVGGQVLGKRHAADK